MNIASRLESIIKDAANKVAKAESLDSVSNIIIEVPKDKKLADLSTNIAMQLCKSKDTLKPFDIAESITKHIKESLSNEKLNEYFSLVEVKHPGFINFHFSSTYLQSVIEDIKKQKNFFGKSNIGNGKKILLEYVSANPTGPLSVAHGRQAAIGDALSNILKFAGYKVTDEYYLNDEGNQIELLGRSLHARYCELLGEEQPFPEAGYKGQYIYDIAKAMVDKHNTALTEDTGKNIDKFCEFGVKYLLDSIKKDLKDFGVDFDSYFSQATLSSSNKIDKALKLLKDKGFLYEKDGALWFRSTDFSDDKDRVLRKSDGSYTYITPDIAYHNDKFKRGFDTLIDMWGPDHHGYIARIKAACKALEWDDNNLIVLIVQLVTLSRDGVPIKMSTREGKFVTLREVIDEVGKDVARFFFLMRRKDSHLDFDLELAKKESMENPVYYIQYAHARICGILEHKKEQSIKGAKTLDFALLNRPEELNVLRLLRDFPTIIEICALSHEPHKLVSYLMELASSFHSFYAKHRVVCDDAHLMSARLGLIEALKSVFLQSLNLLGVSSPEKM